MAASSSAPRWKHDVFLSFRGEDTRNTFTGHLYRHLETKGFKTFIDNQLERGQHISDSLVNAIESSRISIVIFSADYAGSSSCLEELVKILECQQLVLPVFYNINPSVVEKQTGCYAESLAKLEAELNVNSEKMKEWKLALTQVSALSGWHLDKGNEAELIKTIVEKVSVKLNRVPLHVADYPVGLESHIQEMTNMLSFETDAVQFVGVLGLAGIGKTTVAEAVFNRITALFEGSCFLANVRGTLEKKGIHQLQETLLEETLEHERITLPNCDRGINVIKERLCHKRVLIVIDDVNDLQQLKKLAGAVNWFGPGSRIIITTRDEQLLKAHGVERIHYVEELGHNYALELFSWHAFKKSQPDEEYLELSRSIIKYAQCLPLAIVALGSFLCGRNESEWKSALLNLKRDPNKKVNNILKTSFDGLEDVQKAIFLHIACFFKGHLKEHVMKILDACDLNPIIGVKVLAENSLIRIENNRFEMHNLVQAMGRKVVDDESPYIDKRSRLWRQDDVQVLLDEYMGPFRTEALVVDLPHSEEVCAEVFARMRRLKILIVHKAKISGSLKSLSNELRWLDWSRCPLESLPSTFRARKLAALKLKTSCIRELGADFKRFVNLKDLNLYGCRFLTKVPDFSSITNLESLKLHGCEKLEMFPEIGEEMKCLEIIDLRCTAIRFVPRFIGNVSRLKTLNLSYCRQLETVPSSIYYLKYLECLYLHGCVKLEKFPVHETTLEWTGQSSLPVNDDPGSKVFHTLEFLDLGQCNLSNVDFLIEASFFSALRELDLEENNFISLPTSINCLRNLRKLRLSKCRKLQEIPELPLNIERVEAIDCKSLGKYSQLPSILAINWEANQRVTFKFSNCCSLAKNQGTILTDCLQNQKSCAKTQIDVFLPGTKIPEWFSYNWADNTYFSFEVTSQAFEKLEALALCAIAKPGGQKKIGQITRVYFNGQIVHSYSEYFSRLETDHLWLHYLPCCSFRKHVTTAANNGNLQFEVSIEERGQFSGLPFKSCGVHLVYGQSVNPENTIAWSSMVHRQGGNVDRTTGKVTEDSLVVVNNTAEHQTDPMVDEHQMNQWLPLPLKPVDRTNSNPRRVEKLEANNTAAHQTDPMLEEHQLNRWPPLLSETYGSKGQPNQEMRKRKRKPENTEEKNS